MEALEAACDPAADSVEQGSCMSAQVAEVLHPACLEAVASLLELSREQYINLKEYATEVQNGCKQADTEVCCWNHDVGTSHTFWRSSLGAHVFMF